MRILFITHYSDLYGANRSLMNLLNGLLKFGVQPLVIIPKGGEICDVLNKMNIPFILFEFNMWCGNTPIRTKNKFLIQQKLLTALVNNKIKNFENLVKLKKLHKKLGSFNPSFVYSNSSVFNFGLLYAKKYQIPHVWHLREVQEHYNLKWFYNEKNVSKNFNSSEVVIAASHFLKENYELRNGVRNIKVIYNGILTKKELLELDQKRMCSLKKNSSPIIVFGVVGLLHPKKNQMEAIKAFSIVSKKFPKSKLLIIGQGDQSHLKTVAKELGVIDRVEFLGHMKNPFDAYLEMDIFLMCSRLEGFGRVTAEAMASSIPVIGFREGGTKEIIKEGITGFFYDSDYVELAKKMLFLCENPKEIKKMGKRGREFFETDYLLEDHSKAIYEILELRKNNGN